MAPEPAAKKKTRKLSVASLFGLEKQKEEKKEKDEKGEKSPMSEKGAIRRSLQKILSLGHGKEHGGVVNGNVNGETNGNGNGNSNVKESEGVVAVS